MSRGEAIVNKVGFYPGCSLTGTSREYSESVRAIARKLRLELHEVSDWNCCGATAAHSINKELSQALPARILALAERDGMTELVVPCAACYNRLMCTQAALRGKEAAIGETLGMAYSGKIQILNVLQWVERYVMPCLPDVESLFPKKKVACYYGCLLVRPKEVLRFDRLEDPQSMDEIMRMLGAEPLDWAFKTECCGAGFSISRTQSVARLSAGIIDDAAARGAEGIVVACPMCHSNLDMRRAACLKAGLNAQYKDIPVIYITQAIGLALGIGRKELGLNRHFVPVKL